MSATEFTSQRSAAIRQLLLDTVANEPRRRRRLQILLTSILASVAIVLAGGTAALALTGVIHFDVPSPAPAATTTPSTTPHPTQTSTPTPSATARAVHIQSTPIPPKDVNSLPTHPAWSLDLPGGTSTCQQRYTYNIADGLALFAVGSNMGNESTDGCPIGHGNASLTMVDTENGTVIWSREWNWEGDKGMGTFLSILGTSDRALFFDESGGNGPRDLINLSTGATVATLPDDLGSYPNWQMTPVWDSSGDIIYTKPVVNDSAQTVSFEVERVDPLDLSKPKWAITLQATKASVSFPNFAGSGLVPIEYLIQDPSNGWRSGLLDLKTGALGNQAPSGSRTAMGTVIVEYRDFVSGIPRTVAGIDRTTGNMVWSMPFAEGASISDVSTVNGRPGWLAGDYPGAPSGDLVIFSPTTLTLLDGATGAVKMTADVTHCGIAPWFWGNGGREVVLDEARNSLIIIMGTETTCSIDRETGAPTPITDHDSGQGPLFGPKVSYFNGSTINDGGEGQAYDRQSGRELWSMPVAKDEQWFFAGGILVRQIGNHIESIG
jgi:hypothetical protein